MAHALDGAIARIDRADVHMSELKSLIEKLRKTKEYEVLAQQQAKAGQLKPTEKVETIIRNEPVEVPLELSIVTGEVLYNLRSALDYLIYELAREDSGSVKTGTQFPIEDYRIDPKRKQRGFESRRKTYLTGLSNPHIDAIEKLQPYNGIAWTETLRDLSNPDKHRRLTAVGGSANVNGITESGISGSFDNHPGKIVFRGGGAAYYTDHNIDVEYTLDVTLPDGSPLMETLEYLHLKVVETLDSFNPDFK